MGDKEMLVETGEEDMGKPAVVDVSTPAAPAVVGKMGDKDMGTPIFMEGGAAITMCGQHAIIAGGNGLAVVDPTNAAQWPEPEQPGLLPACCAFL